MPRFPRSAAAITLAVILSLVEACGGSVRTLPSDPTYSPGHVGPPAKLQFRIQPTHLTVNTPASPAPQIQIVDTAGNVVTSATNTIILSSGSGNVHILGDTIVQAFGGMATFSNVFPDVCCTTVQLTARSTGLQGAGTTGIVITN